MTINVVTHGLNQLYTIQEEVTDYSNLLSQIYSDETKLVLFSLEFSDTNNLPHLFASLATKYPPEKPLKPAVLFDCLDYIKELKINLYSFHHCQLHSFLDFLMLSQLDIPITFLSFDQISKLPSHSTVIFSNNNKILRAFREIDFFTFLTTENVHLSTSPELDENDVQLLANGKDVEQNGFGFLSTVSYFFHQEILFDWIRDYTSGDKKEFIKAKIKENNVKTVLCFPKLYSNLRKYKKSLFFKSDKNFLFINYAGFPQQLVEQPDFIIMRNFILLKQSN